MAVSRRRARTDGSGGHPPGRTLADWWRHGGMPWTWRYEKTDGAVVSAAGLQEAIVASHGDAESWLGENWRALLEAGGGAGPPASGTTPPERTAEAPPRA